MRSAVTFSEYIDWWKTTSTGRLVEEVTAYDPGRSQTVVNVSPTVDLVAGLTRYNTGDGVTVGRAENASGQSARDAEVYDVSLRIEGLSETSLDNRFSAGVISGLRAGSLLDRGERDRVQTDIVPVMGGDAQIKWSERSMLRASALGDIPGTTGDYVDLRLEQVWRIGSNSSVSLGWRHLRGVMSNEAPELTLQQDSILLELKFGF